jgi:D-glycero-alpha-D-manno-heptose-7-phosphate kinase
MIVTRAPLRIPLGGGGTDLPSYYRHKGGALISAALNKYVYITVNRRFEASTRISYSKTEIVETIDAIEHPIVREALRFLKITDPLEINISAPRRWRKKPIISSATYWASPSASRISIWLRSAAW